MAFPLVLPETYPFSKRKQRKHEKESCFAAKSKRVLFFIGHRSLFFQSCHMLYIKTRAHAQNSQQHRTPGMPCLVECFLQQSGGYLLRKYTPFMGKIFHVSLKVCKKHSL